MRIQSSHVLSVTDQIKKLEDDRDSLQSAKAGLEDECKTLRQKVEILNELYQQKEMALQKYGFRGRRLSVLPFDGACVLLWMILSPS